MTRKTAALAFLVLSALVPGKGVRAADGPELIQWAQLVPKNLPAVQPNRTFFAGSTKSEDGQPPPPPMPEGKFMSMKRRQPGSDRAPEVVTAFNGKRVQIGGYVVPLDFESTKIKEFLLVPFVGACIHVPPPPANQIIYVKAADGFEVTGSFDPVTVTGVLKTEPAFTGLADTGYTIDADDVKMMKQ
ncbi:MAG: DUF3299 domain-containing protein [Hyphomicrobium sp.]